MARGRRRTMRAVGRLARRAKLPSSRDLLKPHANMDYADDEWQRMYRWLVSYKESNGHSCVASGPFAHSRLAYWCHQQRESRSAQSMSSYKIYCLNMVGFVWDANLAQWHAMFMKLLAFQRFHGTCQVDPQRNYCLSSWVRSNQTAYYSGSLQKERVEKLQAIGLDWGEPPKTDGAVSNDLHDIDLGLERMEEWISRVILEESQ